MPDLLPDYFGMSTVTTPLQILREQGLLMAKKSRGLVEGFVTTNPQGEMFRHLFYFRAPSLENYTYLLFTVDHPVDLYPLLVETSVAAFPAEAKNEEQFLDQLRVIFSSEKTKRIVNAIMSQAAQPAAVI
jgi:hypothetical protein